MDLTFTFEQTTTKSKKSVDYFPAIQFPPIRQTLEVDCKESLVTKLFATSYPAGELLYSHFTLYIWSPKKNTFVTAETTKILINPIENAQGIKKIEKALKEHRLCIYKTGSDIMDISSKMPEIHSLLIKLEARPWFQNTTVRKMPPNDYVTFQNALPTLLKCSAPNILIRRCIDMCVYTILEFVFPNNIPYP